MARRNRGFGAVFLRADGRWEGQIRIGGGRRRSFYARAFLEYWLMVCRTRLRPITLVNYARDVRPLTVVLGDIPLRKLTPGLIQSGYALLDQAFRREP